LGIIKTLCIELKGLKDTLKVHQITHCICAKGDYTYGACCAPPTSPPPFPWCFKDLHDPTVVRIWCDVAQKLSSSDCQTVRTY
jgi:hypothetical protein